VAHDFARREGHCGEGRRIRRGLDVDELMKSVSMGKGQLFDLAAAHELYVALFAPIEALIKDKPLLLIAPSGPLTALPFHLLVTDKPAIAVPQMRINDMAAYGIRPAPAQELLRFARASAPHASALLFQTSIEKALTKCQWWQG
jgi:CHAT domain-containing protein